MTNDPLDQPDTTEEWGVYHTECSICHKPIAIVAVTHAIQFGYAAVLPQDELICAECGGTDRAQPTTEAVE